MPFNWKYQYQALGIPSSSEIHKKWKSLKSRTCPTLTIPLGGTITIIVILSIVYNALTTYMSTGYSVDGMVRLETGLRTFFTMLYGLFSSALLWFIRGCVKRGGRRRVFGLWVGRRQLKIYLHLSAAIHLIGVIVMAALISSDHSYDPCPDHDSVYAWGSSTVVNGVVGWQGCNNRTHYNSCPWLTTVGPGGVMMVLVAWVAGSEAEEAEELEDEYGDEHDTAGLPAYSLVGDSEPPVLGSEVPVGSPHLSPRV